MLICLVGVTNGIPLYAAPPGETVYLPIVSQEPPLLNAAIDRIEPAAVGSTATFHTPLDATPDPDGNQIYFTALSSQGAGVFRVPAAGGAAVQLTAGTPLTMPVGLVISSDGQTLYLADPRATVAASQSLSNTGVIFSLPSSGGVPTPIAATLHTAPRGLTLVRENQVDMIYFTGVAPEDGQPAIMKVPASGGPLTVVEKEEGLVEPVGIAVSQDGTLYVADQNASEPTSGKIYRFAPHDVQSSSSHRELLAGHVHLGQPAGITLTQDESLLLVSALHNLTGTSQVLVIDTTTAAHHLVNTVIGANHASGGLHRAHNNNTMAWCGVTAGTGGQGIVFRVTLQ